MDTTSPDEDETLDIPFLIYNLCARVTKLKLQFGITGWSFIEVRAFRWGYHTIPGSINQLALTFCMAHIQWDISTSHALTIGILENLEYARFPFSFSRSIFQNGICPINP